MARQDTNPGGGATPEDTGTIEHPLLSPEEQARIDMVIKQFARVDNILGKIKLKGVEGLIADDHSVTRQQIPSIDGTTTELDELIITYPWNADRDNPNNEPKLIANLFVDHFKPKAPFADASFYRTDGSSIISDNYFDSAFPEIVALLDKLGFPPAEGDAVNLDSDDADGLSTEPQIPDYPAKAYRDSQGQVVIEIPGIPSPDGDGSFTPTYPDDDLRS